MPDLIPYVLERKIVPKVWGGRALESVLGLDLPPGDIGETWEVYDRPDGASGLRGADGSLHDLVREHGDRLLGEGVDRAVGGRFPLIIKLIDAARALSIQVHPDDAQAAEVGDSGKPEAWVVLHAGPEGCIRRGLRPGVTREAFAAAVHGDGVLDLLETFVPQAGDAVHVPAGTVHALGPDVVVFEVQRNSDVTYRLWDWGRDREMHLADGLRAIRFDLPTATTVEPVPMGSDGQWLVQDPRFRVRRMALVQPITFGSEGTFKVMTVISGSATLGWRSEGRHAPLLVGPGDSVVIPAATQTVFLSPVGRLDVLVCDPGIGI